MEGQNAREAAMEKQDDGGAEVCSRCPICLDDYGADVSCAVPCMHRFCYECLSRWVDSSSRAQFALFAFRGRRGRCPVCRCTIRSIIHSIKSDETFEERVLCDFGVYAASYDYDDSSDREDEGDEDEEGVDDDVEIDGAGGGGDETEETDVYRPVLINTPFGRTLVYRHYHYVRRRRVPYNTSERTGESTTQPIRRAVRSIEATPAGPERPGREDGQELSGDDAQSQPPSLTTHASPRQSPGGAESPADGDTDANASAIDDDLSDRGRVGRNERPGGIPLSVWARLITTRPYILTALLPWIRARLGAMYAGEPVMIDVLCSYTAMAFSLSGPDEEILTRMMRSNLGENTRRFVREFLDYAMPICTEALLCEPSETRDPGEGGDADTGGAESPRTPADGIDADAGSAGNTEANAGTDESDVVYV